MRPLAARAGLVLALLPVVAPSAGAWSANEHKAIALVAQDLLRRKQSPALVAAQDILGSGVTLDGVAPCPDSIRHPPKDSPGPISCGGLSLPGMPQSSHWHFIDTAVNYRSPDSPSGLDAFCPGGDCVVQAIRDQVAALQAPGGDKKIPLMFLVHLVGDAHQPLHCATEYYLGPDGQPKQAPKGGIADDGGGNAKPAKIPGVFTKYPLELHSLWDHDLEGFDSAEPRALADELLADIKTQDTNAWTSGDFVKGAAFESFVVARETIYPAYYANLDKDGKTMLVQPDYQTQMKVVAKQRMEMAGVRLAALLEQALSPKTGSAPVQPAR
jgi:hypothetical protein